MLIRIIYITIIIIIIIIIIMAFKNYNKQIPKNGKIFQKSCQEINIKNVSINYEIVLLSHKFPIY